MDLFISKKIKEKNLVLVTVLARYIDIKSSLLRPTMRNDGRMFLPNEMPESVVLSGAAVMRLDSSGSPLNRER